MDIHHELAELAPSHHSIHHIYMTIYMVNQAYTSLIEVPDSSPRLYTAVHGAKLPSMVAAPT